MSGKCQQHQPLYAQLLKPLAQDGLNLESDNLPASRSECEQALQHLQHWQVPLIRNGQHYRLKQAIQALEADKIYLQLNAATQQRLQTLHVFAALNSSNDFLLQQKNPHQQACLADYQSAGRGQQGKPWLAAFASSLCLSVGYHYAKAPPAGLSLALAINLVKQLAQQGYHGIQLKWPNDLLWQGQKLAGILVEMRHNSAGCTTIVGLGLNWQSQPQSPDFAYGRCDLSQICPTATPDHNILAANLLETLLQTLDDFPTQGLAAYQSAWQTLDALQNQPVHIQQVQTILTGIARGIDTQGALQLEQSNGERLIIQQGSVRLKPKDTAP